MGILCFPFEASDIMMGTFAAALLTCLVATTSADITCDDCLEFGDAISNYLQSEASLAEQTAILVAGVCPQTSDAADCEAELNIYWSQIGLAMYPVFLEPTSDECVGSVILVSEVIKSDAKIADIVAFLQGDFCASTGDATCGDAISQLMPLAMPVLAGVLAEKASEYCCTLSPSGVCC